MLKKERFNAKQNTAMGQIPRSIERISSFRYRIRYELVFFTHSIGRYRRSVGLLRIDCRVCRPNGTERTVITKQKNSYVKKLI